MQKYLVFRITVLDRVMISAGWDKGTYVSKLNNVTDKYFMCEDRKYLKTSLSNFFIVESVIHYEKPYYDWDTHELTHFSPSFVCPICGRSQNGAAWTSQCPHCRDEFYRCEICGTSHIHGDSIKIGQHTICPECAKRAKRCKKCGKLTLRQTENGLCEECRKYTSKVLNYGFKPEYTYFDGKDKMKEKLYLGIEFEVETHNRTKKLAKGITRGLNLMEGSPWFYKKHDGSLSSGFEIVTQPFSLEYHKKLPWRTLMQYLKINGATSDSTGTTGIHIHFDKEFLSKDEQLNFAKLFMRHRSNISKISRRESSYAEFSSFDRVVRDGTGSLCNHYSAVNYANEHTIEIRTFKGTLSYKVFIATLEFADAFIRWSKIHECLHQCNDSAEWNNFLDYCIGKYPRFLGYYKTVTNLNIETVDEDEEDEEQCDDMFGDVEEEEED